VRLGMDVGDCISIRTSTKQEGPDGRWETL
jgi:hypothetical protein